MNEHRQPEPDILDSSAAPARVRRRRPSASALVLAAAIAVALAAGPAVASYLASAGSGIHESGPAAVVQAPPLPASGDTANQREGRDWGSAPTPTSTGDNANQRESRDWGTAPRSCAPAPGR